MSITNAGSKGGNKTPRKKAIQSLSANAGSKGANTTPRK